MLSISRLIPLALSLVLAMSCAATTEPVTFDVTPTGGSVSFANGTVTLIFPPGAVTAPVNFTATPVANPVGATVVAGTVFDIQPSMTFSQPVQLFIRYTAGSVPSGVREAEVGIYKLTGSLWTKVAGTTVDVIARTVTASITSFSAYGIIGAPVASVVVSPAAPVLQVAGTAQLTATARDESGAPLPSRGATWMSSAPAIATVSSSGLVTAVAVGTATMTATSEGVTGTAVVTVSTEQQTPPLLASADFDDGTLGSTFTNPWGTGLDFPTDPTNSGKGRVARFTYAPASGGSVERALAYVSPPMRYNQTLWMRGYVYFPTGASPYNAAHNRKILDYQGRCARVTPHRVGNGDLKVSIVDCMNGTEQEVMDPSTGIVLANDTWYLLEMRITTNSADNLRDGILEIFINGSPTPNFRQATGLGWITEKGTAPSFFNTYLIGFQLTINGGDPVYSEVRYWDKVAFATTRIGN